MSFPSLPKTQRTYKHPIWPHVIKYTAFSAGQQSLLLQVADPETDLKERIDTLSAVFDQSVDAGASYRDLPVCVAEKIFLLMREISIGDIMKIRYQCNAQVDGKECGQEITMPIDLKEVDIVTPDTFRSDFELAGGYFLRMRLPTYGSAARLDNKADIPLLIASFVSALYNEEEAWEIKDPEEDGITPEEKQVRRANFEEFVAWVGENIDVTIINTLMVNFFNSLPAISYKTKLKCPKCGTEHPISFNGLNSIFI